MILARSVRKSQGRRHVIGRALSAVLALLDVVACDT